MGGGRFVPGNKPWPYHHVIFSHDESSRDALTKENVIFNDESSDLSAFTLQESMRDIIHGSRFSMSQYSSRRDSREEEEEEEGNGYGWKREESSPDSEQGKTNKPPAPVGFWHSGLRSVRKQVYLEWGRTSKPREPISQKTLLTFVQR